MLDFLAQLGRHQRRFLNLILVFFFLLLMGTAGYHLLEGWPWVDALYMAVITVTTVGFGETHPLSGSGRVFTIILIFIGVGAVTYGLRTMTDYVVAGELEGFFGARRMRRQIRMLRNHFIICGYGRLGHEVCRELLREGRSLVVVDDHPPSVEHAKREGLYVVVGDAGLDLVLKQAGIERAKGLVAASDDDAKNILVVVSARALKPSLSIVARVSSEEASEKFLRVGADSIFLPYRTGGRRMAQVLLRPEVSGFLEEVLYNKSALGLQLDNFEVEEGSELDGKSMESARVRESTGASIVGLKRKDTGVVANLTPKTPFQAGDTLIVLGSENQFSQLARLLERRQGERNSELEPRSPKREA